MNEELKKILSEMAKEFQLSDENLEKVVDKLSKIFESAVDAKVSVIITEKEDEYRGELLKEATETKENLVDTLDRYLEEAVENYALDFGDVMVNATKAELFESFTKSLKEAYENHGLKLEEGSEKVVSELKSTAEELKEQVNDYVNENIQLKESLLAEKVKTVFIQETIGMTELDREKLKDLLAESDFSDAETAREKIVIMKEHFVDHDDNEETLTEETKPDKTIVTSERSKRMSQYLNK
jgi:chemotaxis regulatin CheY-phosphate phosphatase CheZ